MKSQVDGYTHERETQREGEEERVIVEVEKTGEGSQSGNRTSSRRSMSFKFYKRD